MKLCERVRLLSIEVAKSQSNLAKQLGLSQATFSGYLNEKRQDNLWPLLAGILDLYPQISREWLYFDEGEMLRAATERTPTSEELETLKSKVAEVDSLKDRLLGALARNEALHRELNEAKDKIIRLQERQEAESLDKVDVADTPPTAHGEASRRL